MQRIGIGYEFYKQFIDQKLYYVDKTLIIRDILEKGGQTTLFLRPRRFGKTLALTTLQTFFELEYDREGNVVDNRRYFEGKKIMEAGEEVLSHLGQHPVIFLTLKSAKMPTYSGACYMLRTAIIDEIRRHDYLLGSGALSDEEKGGLKELLRGEMTWRQKSEGLPYEGDAREIALKEHMEQYAGAIGLLSKCLKQHHGKNVIILIDEYDVPLENAHFEGFYPEMVGFIRSFFESALKTNTALERAVITGCLRISRESIFTGLNNLKINSMLGEGFGEGFGFTLKDPEAIGDFVTELLEKSISTFDSSESFYHGFFLSLVGNIGSHSARSNREAGDGRPDIILYPDRPKDPAYIFECKVRKKFNEMEDGLNEAFAQIDDKHYEDGILEEGYAGAVSYGMCFCKKSCVAGLKPQKREA